jgi:hypothetical protein
VDFFGGPEKDNFLVNTSFKWFISRLDIEFSRERETGIVIGKSEQERIETRAFFGEVS